jgi:hypothetical protein
MKTNIFKITIFLMLAVCFIDCNKTKEDITTVLSPDEIFFFAEETSKKGAVVITQGLIDWDFHYSADWFTAEKVSDFIIVIPKTPNIDSSQREANITITTLGYSPVTLSVIQLGTSK